MKKFSNLSVFSILNFSSPEAKGRCSMLASAVTAGIVNNLTGGIFYTGFLIANDIDIVNVGIISFIPHIASLFSIFSPMLLERFQKRKVLLAILKLLYYSLNILGITLLPTLVHDKQLKVLFFAVILFLAGIINSIATSGYSSWQVNFIPDKVRADYFTLQHLFSNLMAGIVIVCSGMIADALSGSEKQIEIITLLRFVAFGLAIIDIIILSLPKEYPYKHSYQKLSLVSIFTTPFKCKPFILVMAVVFSRNFSSILSGSTLNYYLLNDVGVKYTFINGISAVYFIFFIIFSKFWKQLIYRKGWLLTFAIAQLIWVPSQMLYAFTTTSNYVWLMLIVRLTQHFLGVGISVTVSNMAFIHLPESDRTNYISFFTITSSVSNFLGMMSGTLLTSMLQNATLNLFGFKMVGAQMVIFIQSLFELMTVFIAVIASKKITRITSIS